MAISWQCLCVDASDPISLGQWWAEALGWRVTYQDADEVVLEPPAGSPQDGVSPDILFLKVPEAKTIKNRLHIDLRPDVDQDTEVARLERLGAVRVDVGQQSPTWVVMADPEGNEFCVLRVLTEEEKAA